MSLEKIKKQLAQMIAIAENPASTPGESRTAMAMAERLMRKHNLDRSDIEAMEDGTFNIDRVTMHRQSVTLLSTRKTLWEMQLARFMCKFMGTVAYYNNPHAIRKEPDGSEARGRMYGSTVVFYGPTEDVQMACHLFRDLALLIQSKGMERFGGWAKAKGGAYCQGFVNGLDEANARVERDKLKGDISGGERGMILADQQLKKQLIVKAKNWLSTDQNIKLRSAGRMSGSNNGQAYSAGQRDGRRTTVSKNRPQRIS